MVNDSRLAHMQNDLGPRLASLAGKVTSLTAAPQ